MSYKKRKPSFSRLIKAALTTFLVLIGLLLFILVLFYINKDNIGRKIIAETSKRTNSVITFNDIHLSPFVQLPSVSVTLTNIKILEKKAFMDSLEKPIANIEELHAGINILKLFKGHIDVSRITLEGGNFNLIQNVDSSYNFIEAFSPSETDHSIHKQPKPSEPNNSNKFSKSEMDLSINQVYFKNVALNYHSRLSRKSAVAMFFLLSRIR